MNERPGLLLLGLLLAAGGLIGGLFGYFAIGFACSGTDVSEPSDHAFCDIHPGGASFFGLAVFATV